MNYLPHLFFLASLSMLSLVMLALLLVLDFANVAAKQKIYLLKIGLVLIAISPFIFNLLRSYSWPTLEITLPGQFINQTLAPKISVALIKQRIDVPFYLFLVYGIGLFMMLSRILSSYLSAKKQLAASLPALIQGHSVFLNKTIQSPLNFGFPKGKIYFPFDTEEKWTPREIQMSLAHEKCHVEHNDSLWKLLSLFVQALLFFVPWSYSLHRRLELEMEIICDETTCIDAGADFHEYGSLLLAMTCIQTQNLIFNNITNSTLKKRLLAMKTKTTKRPILISLLSTVLLFAGSTAIATTSGIPGNNSVFKITSKLFIDGKLVSRPVIIAHANQKALIVITETNKSESQGLRVELVARDIKKLGRNDAIGINYDIEFKNGEEKMHSKPQVIVLPNQEGKISLSSDSGHSYEMHVLAERE